MNAASTPPSIRAGDPATAATGAAAAVRRFASLTPALLAGVLVLRAWSLFANLQAGAGTGTLIAWGMGEDLLTFLRGLPLLFLLSWPLLARPGRVRVGLLVLLWTLWLFVPIALEQYYLAARVPLGSDLFGYSWQEVRTTADGGMRTDAIALAGMLLPLFVLWSGLAWRLQCAPWRSGRAAAALLIAGTALWWLPMPKLAAASEDARLLARNKTAYFVGDSLRYVWSEPSANVAVANTSAPIDPRYPFLHDEHANDALGPHFNIDAAHPPHLVFIIVEGLGRSFSGPDAARGSFTPFLDELAGRGLYWSNFLAAQGRTFAVLPSVFGSLPFGEKGFAALGSRMPPHAGLLSVLQRQGYQLRFYTGTDSDFDNERAYLQGEGVEAIVDSRNFGSGYTRNPFSSWGYDDGELVARVLADSAPQSPSATVIQTMTMHSSYRFPGLEAYRRRFEQRLDELQIADVDKPGYRQFGDVYASVLFTDAALRRYFEAMARRPDYANTIFVITGDHRLPEIPMDTKIERYHVPLLVYSPLLKQPARFRSVSSHLDLAPSLLAFLSHNYGLKRPQRVTWTGSGLDVDTAFRGNHDIPLKHAKTILADFVSGRWFLSHDQLYALEDGMRLTPVSDATTQAQVSARFAGYQQANAQFARALQLSPEGARPALATYAASGASRLATTDASRAPSPTPPQGLSVSDVRAPEGSDADTTQIGAVFANGGDQRSPVFVPLLVVSDEQGREVRESYAAPLQIDAAARQQTTFALDTRGLSSGRYFLAVIPSHPDSGRSLGRGSYRIPFLIRCCGPGGGARARP